MKKVIALCLSAILIIFAFCACGQITKDKTTPENSALEETAPPAAEGDAETDSAHDVPALPETNYFTEKIKESPDKYTWYIKNYVGRNCATIGYLTGGYLKESYGEGSIKIVMITEDGNLVTEDTLKDYVVIEQSVEPNTELKYVFGRYSNGEEASFVEDQNIEEIEVLVRRVEGAQSPSE